MTRAASNVLVNHVSENHSATMDISWVLWFSFLTALLAQFDVRLPFTPVPLTGQTFAVLLSGAVLGSRRAFASQALYLVEGVSGLPVFAGGGFSLAHILGPTGGYLWSYPFAAALLGWLVERGASRKTWRMAIALILSDMLILVSGVLWLHAIFGIPFRKAILLGFYPFLIGDILKIVLVSLSLPRILKRYEHPD